MQSSGLYLISQYQCEKVCHECMDCDESKNSDATVRSVVKLKSRHIQAFSYGDDIKISIALIVHAQLMVRIVDFVTKHITKLTDMYLYV